LTGSSNAAGGLSTAFIAATSLSWSPAKPAFSSDSRDCH
jgi:hypothetical protein